MRKESKSERVVIVGTGEQGALAHEYFSNGSPHEVVAFSAESPFITDDVYRGLPVVAFETLAKAYPPDEYRTFIAVSDIQLNRVRSRLYSAVKEAGFSCVSCFSDRAFILPSAKHGDNLFAQEFTSLQHNVRIGNNVFLSSGTCVGHSSTMEDDCYTGPHAVICGGVTIRRGSFLGANCCILETVTVAEDCIIGAGAVVLRDTEPGQVYVGSPARPTGRDSLVTAGVVVG